MAVEKANANRTEISELGKTKLIKTLLKNRDETKIDFTQVVSRDSNYIWATSHTLMLEGIDFDLIYMPLKYLGYKSLVISFGELYSKGYTPESISIRIAISKRFSLEDLESYWSGVEAGIDEFKIKNVSLDINTSLTGMTISISSQGKQDEKTFVQKRAPKSGDLLAISGNLGAAYLGFQLLEREKRVFSETGSQPKLDDHKFILKEYLNPEINTSFFREMQNVGIYPITGEFLYRGVSDSIKTICNNFDLGAKVFLDKIPIAAQTFEMADEMGIDSITSAMNGGGDVRFLFVLPLEEYDNIHKQLPQLDFIGHLTSDISSQVLVTPDGAEIDLKAQAWSE